MTKICIARLRQATNYVEPLSTTICDSFFELLKKFIQETPEHQYYYYNCGFNTKPRRDIDAIAQSDVIIIPSEAEFTYWVPGMIHTLDAKRSHEHVSKLIPHVKGKKIILLRSDRRDDEELYRTRVFPGVDFECSTIDEVDFPGNIHGMKYYFIKNSNRTLFDDTPKRDIDFCYWGSNKRKTIDGKLSGDERHVILKGIRNSDLNTFFIGNFHGFKRDLRWAKMSDIVPYLKRSKSTLCFNWMSNTATTSRYIEAMACGMMPFVWKDYDITNRLVVSDWLRVISLDDFLDKINHIKSNWTDKTYDEQFFIAEEQFLKKIVTPEQYYDLFSAKLKGCL